jgi:threonine dehydratase
VSTAVAAGRVVEVPVGDTIADGLLGNIESNAITPRIAAETGVSFVVVDEVAIRQAVVELALAAGVVAEGSAAVALAALRRGVLTATQPTVLVVSGRNIAAPLFADLLGNR